MELANMLYKQERKIGDHKDAILKEVTANSMAQLYEQLPGRFSWQIDAEVLREMNEKNSAELTGIEAKLVEAVANAGDTEVLDCLFTKAKALSRTGNWEEANKAFDAVLAREKISTGKKIDATMEKAKIALFNMDTAALKDLVAEAKKLNDVGGDWDRRNRLKVYEVYYLLSVRDLTGASKMLQDCVATFTCTELCTYQQFMFYTLLTSVIALDRNDLRKKVINDPNVITVQRELPRPQALLSSIYQCDYAGFFKAILAVHGDILEDRFLGPVAVYLVREYRVLAYAQFLEAYKSVMLSPMAASFGISTDLLDAELSRFIAAGRLNAKIDKVGDIIETIRPDRKNAQYQDVIKKGDHLLNQIQKLVRAIDV